MADDQGPNMEVRAFIAVVLSLAVMLGYQYFFAPSPPAVVDPGAEIGVPSPVPPSAGPSAGGETAGGETDSSSSGSEDPSDPSDATDPGETGATEETGPAAIGEDRRRSTTVETARYRMQIDNRGGRITSLVLLDYLSDFGGPLELVARGEGLEDSALLGFLSPDNPAAATPANDALYEVTIDGAAAPSTVRVDRPVEIAMRWVDGNGWNVDKRLVVMPDSYLSDLSVFAQSPTNNTFFVSLGPGLEMDSDTTRAGIYLMRGAVIFDDSGVEHINDADIEAPEVRSAPFVWGGIQSNYFVALFAPRQPASIFIDAVPDPEAADAETEAPDAAAEETGGTFGTRAAFGLSIPAGGVVDTALYMGPKDYEELAAAGYGLERAVDYGMFRILARPVAVTLDALNDFTGNYGIAIILATLGVRLIFFPLSQSSMKSMRKMQQLQPQMNAIRAKYKGVKDVQKRQEMNTEVMQLYKDNGVSPLGGCLPMLLQMPVLFGFYAAISVSIGIRQAPFALWLQDLSKMDPFYVLPLLMGGAMFVQQRMSPGTGDPVQQRIFRLMPIMFTFFFLTFPSGLVIYWLMNTVLGIAQQAYVNHQLDAPDAKATTSSPKNKKKKKGGETPKGGGAKRRKRGKKK